jgi:hypothetical protein
MNPERAFQFAKVCWKTLRAFGVNADEHRAEKWAIGVHLSIYG